MRRRRAELATNPRAELVFAALAGALVSLVTQQAWSALEGRARQREARRLARKPLARRRY